MEQLIERARVLLGWPTTRKILELVQRFPEETWWRYAMESLERAERPNERYLISCLETAQARQNASREIGLYPGGLGDRGCPWCSGLVCSWAARGCKGWQQCHRPQPWLLRALRDINAGDTEEGPPGAATH